jgi:hypothetical protein
MRLSARALLLGAAAAVVALGCRSSGDQVERALHARELDLLEAREELDHCRAINQDLQTELQALHGDPATCPPGGCDKPASLAYPVHTLTLGRQTGGRDSDGTGGDDSLQVVVEPRDADNQAVKAPGTLVVQALEITSTGVKRPLSSWHISEDELRRSYRSGLLTTGYVLVLPWKIFPSTEKLRVAAQLRTADGRLFEADKDVTIRVVPAAKRPAPVPAPLPVDEPLLPPPHPVDPRPDHGPDLKPPPTDPATTKAAWLLPATRLPTPSAQILRPVTTLSQKLP